ncbi:MAG: hypothetical protein AAF235_04905 [Planctomycetota bacterium]
MPVLFVGYALLVWYFAARYRRTIVAHAANAVGLIGLLGVNTLHTKLNDWTQGDIYLPVLQSLMYPYTAFVAGVGLYIACLPRRSAIGCSFCGYDLHGLAKPGAPVICPECGKQSGGARPTHRPSGVERDDLAASDFQPDIPTRSLADRVPETHVHSKTDHLVASSPAEGAAPTVILKRSRSAAENARRNPEDNAGAEDHDR